MHLSLQKSIVLKILEGTQVTHLYGILRMTKDTLILSPRFILSTLGKEKNHIQGKVSDSVRTSQRLYKSDTLREICFERTKQGQ